MPLKCVPNIHMNLQDSRKQTNDWSGLISIIINLLCIVIDKNLIKIVRIVDDTWIFKTILVNCIFPLTLSNLSYIWNAPISK